MLPYQYQNIFYNFYMPAIHLQLMSIKINPSKIHLILTLLNIFFTVPIFYLYSSITYSLASLIFIVLWTQYHLIKYLGIFQGQCLINVGGDVVNVSYFGNDKQQQPTSASSGNC